MYSRKLTWSILKLLCNKKIPEVDFQLGEIMLRPWNGPRDAVFDGCAQGSLLGESRFSFSCWRIIHMSSTGNAEIAFSHQLSVSGNAGGV
jgi:hypothetical protein